MALLMTIQALVEVSSDLAPQQQKSLVSWAYRLSRSGRVMLLLRGISRAAVDRMLDETVATEGLDVKGLLYADPGEDNEAMRVAADASIVVASTEPFRAMLQTRGVAVVDLPAADAGARADERHEGPGRRRAAARGALEATPTLA
jgi:hypothetical protein